MTQLELKELWSFSTNQLTGDRARSLAAAAVEQVKRQQRRRRLLLLYVFAMVPASTILALWMLLSKGIPMDEAMPALLILAAQWISAVALLRAFGKQPASNAAHPIRETIAAMLHETKVRCRELQILLGLFVAVTPLAILTILQLQASGKMRPNEAASAGVVFGAILLVMGGFLLYELIVRKIPERTRLQGLVDDYR